MVSSSFHWQRGAPALLAGRSEPHRQAYSAEDVEQTRELFAMTEFSMLIIFQLEKGVLDLTLTPIGEQDFLV